MIVTQEQYDEQQVYQYVVMIARYEQQWVFVRHAQRTTLEFVGGKVEVNESLLEAAKRELYEECGAKTYQIYPLGAYGVHQKASSYGMVYYVEIATMGDLPDFEIAEVVLKDQLDVEWTYPNIQPLLYQFYEKKIQHIKKAQY